MISTVDSVDVDDVLADDAAVELGSTLERATVGDEFSSEL